MKIDSDVRVDAKDEVLASKNIACPGQMKVDGWYARYVLGVLVLVYVFNYLDRQVLVILAEAIKKDLGISDADLGFLYGTAFAVFYATFGVALGRLADVWKRKNLISIGLGFWSFMTVLSGLAKGFLPLAACRFGVGVGESSSAPAAYSMLYDYFSPKIRTTVLAIYASGGVVGAPLGIFLGGLLLNAWGQAWPDTNQAPLGLKAWQATFMIVGLPGLLMALWVSTLREPMRGQSDGIYNEPTSKPFREPMIVLASMLPICNFWILRRDGDKRAVICNILFGLIIIVAAIGLARVTGDSAQWIALGIASYAAASWAQGLAKRDPVIFGMIFHCKALMATVVGLSIALPGLAAVGFWKTPFLQRYHDISAVEVGTVLGVGGMIAGLVGVILGGVIADILRSQTAKGKLCVLVGGLAISALSSLTVLTADHIVIIYGASISAALFFSMAVGPILSTVNDLVLPRGRATTSAFYLMVSGLTGLGLGPYLFGYISDLLAANGMGSGEALQQSLLWALLAPVIGLPFFIVAMKHIEEDEASLKERARALGEDI